MPLQDSKGRRPRRYDSEATQRDLIEAARGHFAAEGYRGANAETVAKAAGVTRGALYHHFGSKLGLFRAVLEAVQTEIGAEIARTARSVDGGPLERLRVGFGVYLDMALREDVRRIVLIDGPAALGWEEWREIDLRHGYRATLAALEAAEAAGEIEAGALAELAHLLIGAVTQAGLEIGRADDPAAARAAYGEAVDGMVARLRL